MDTEQAIPVAYTPKRDHANGAVGQWWSEYRVRPLSEAERNTEQTWRYRYVLERRYRHEQGSEDCQHHNGDWRHWDYGQTVEQTIRSCTGDSWYLGAVSQHPEHAAMVRDWQRARRLSKARDVLFRQTHEEYFPKGTYRELNIEQDEREQAEARYIASLKRARLYTAAVNGTAPAERIARLQAEAKVEYQRRVAERTRRHAAMLTKYHELERLDHA